MSGVGLAGPQATLRTTPHLPPVVGFVTTARDVTGGAEEGLLGLLRYYPRDLGTPLVVARPGGEIERAVHGLSLAFAAWAPPTLPFGIRGIKPMRLASGILRARRELIRAVGHHAPSVLTSHSLEAHVVVAAVGAKLPCPTVWHVRDLHTPAGERATLRLAYTRTQPSCIFLTQAARDTFPGPGDVGPVLADGVDLQRFPEVPDASRQALRTRWGFGDEDLVVLYLGQILPRKRVDLLLDAMDRLHAASGGSTVRLIVAGEGTDAAYVQTLRQRAGSASWSASCHFVGRVRPVQDLLAATDALVLPSEGEALGLVLLEAMACARPVIAARDGGMTEAVIPGRTGLLFSPNNAMELADALHQLTDATLRTTLGHAGRARVEADFDARVQARQMAMVHAAAGART